MSPVIPFNILYLRPPHGLFNKDGWFFLMANRLFCSDRLLEYRCSLTTTSLMVISTVRGMVPSRSGVHHDKLEARCPSS